jgi:hypothetical protein
VIQQKALYDCKQQFNQLDGIIFNTQTTKFGSGIRTRIEAERNLVEVKNAFHRL